MRLMFFIYVLFNDAVTFENFILSSLDDWVLGIDGMIPTKLTRSL